MKKGSMWNLHCEVGREGASESLCKTVLFFIGTDSSLVFVSPR